MNQDNGTGGRGSFSSLPGHLLPGLLLFLDGSSLAAWEQVCITARASIPDFVWAACHRSELAWLYHCKPTRFPTWRDLYVSLRQASSKHEVQQRPGGIHVLGGCDVYRDEVIATVRVLGDVGSASVIVPPTSQQEGGSASTSISSSYQAPIQIRDTPRLIEARSALGVTRDHEDRITVVGGWSGEEALASVEQFNVLASRAGRWTRLAPLGKPRCFVACVTDRDGRIHALGGGDSVWQGSAVYSCSEYLEAGASKWTAGLSMNVPRCGHGACVTEDGVVMTAGGYGGGSDYLRSTEMLLPGADRWLAIQDMHLARTGLGLAYGPDRCIYAVGGSPNGRESHRSVERLDLRVGKWEKVGLMIAPRSYCAAAFGPSGLLYAVGGHASMTDEEEEEEDDVLVCHHVEVLDVRRPERWRILPGSDRNGVRSIDLAACFSLAASVSLPGGSSRGIDT